MNRNHLIILSLAVLLLTQLSITAHAAPNIDPANRFAWSENTGWFNFLPNGGAGVEVTATHLNGFVWGENIGWIKLGADGGGPYANSTANNWGVNRNPITGALSGFGWSENVGWVNFSQVTINPVSGAFDGYAWAENVGWIHLRNAARGYGVATLLTVMPNPAAAVQDIPTLSGVGLAVLALLLLVLLSRWHSSGLRAGD